MKAIAYNFGLLVIACMAAGCDPQPTPVPIQPVTIGVSDFCEIMKATLPPTGKPTWDVADSVPTITDARRVGAAVDSRCGKPVVSATATKRG